jgi:hypothetical protein
LISRSAKEDRAAIRSTVHLSDSIGDTLTAASALEILAFRADWSACATPAISFCAIRAPHDYHLCDALMYRACPFRYFSHYLAFRFSALDLMLIPLIG